MASSFPVAITINSALLATTKFNCRLPQPSYTTFAMASAKYCTVPEDTPAIEIRPDLSMKT